MAYLTMMLLIFTLAFTTTISASHHHAPSSKDDHSTHLVFNFDLGSLLGSRSTIQDTATVTDEAADSTAAKSRSPRAARRLCGMQLNMYVQQYCGTGCTVESTEDLSNACCHNKCDAADFKRICCPTPAEQ
ncbi:Protein CBG25790 [Caenorhabditis briggsae]|uniref:Protein CBG25790 n=1 Tax=Caenorhabditis briggsae TaxID=6238 RepID=B6IGL3_CAEBR|nr:Protein CBG25790 [Caenorhabditis briggsae]CAR99043.1 Protein CBG25790 [Caenorhabditis briggsae]